MLTEQLHLKGTFGSSSVSRQTEKPHSAAPSILYFWVQLSLFSLLVIPTPHLSLAVCLPCWKLNLSASPAPKLSLDPVLACFTACSLLLPSCERRISHLRLKSWQENSCAIYPLSPEFQTLCFSTATYCQHRAPKHGLTTEWLALAAGCMGPLHMEQSQRNKMVSWDSLLPVCPSLSSYHMIPVMTT